MNKLNLVLVKADDWEGLYKYGELIAEGHTLNEGVERVIYFVGLAKDYDLDLSELEVIGLNREQQEQLEMDGSLPDNFYDIEGFYEKYA